MGEKQNAADTISAIAAKCLCDVELSRMKANRNSGQRVKDLQTRIARLEIALKVLALAVAQVMSNDLRSGQALKNALRKAERRFSSFQIRSIKGLISTI